MSAPPLGPERPAMDLTCGRLTHPGYCGEPAAMPPSDAVSESDRLHEPDTDIDLFSGPGGWEEGARALGLRPIGIEWDDAACRTGKAAGHHRVRADVAALSTLPMVGKVRGLIASPPCQTFSMAGKGAGRDALPELQDAVEAVWRGATPQSVCPADLDPRSVLVLEPVRYARDLRPEWIVCEQVPAVAPIWQAFAVMLRRDGYSVWTGDLNTADYGLAQTRIRRILIASRVRAVQPPAPTHAQFPTHDLFGESLLTWPSMADVLGWGMTSRPYPTIACSRTTGGPDMEKVGGSAARAAIYNEQAAGRWVLRNGSQANACIRRADEPAGTLFFGHQLNDVSWYPSMEAARPRTQVGVEEKRQAVRISLTEAALLQGFRADYPWQGNSTKQFQQVGNAVPPPLATHVLAAVLGVAVPTACEVAA